jgi:hypothetical protein
MRAVGSDETGEKSLTIVRQPKTHTAADTKRNGEHVLHELAVLLTPWAA